VTLNYNPPTHTHWRKAHKLLDMKLLIALFHLMISSWLPVQVWGTQQQNHQVSSQDCDYRYPIKSTNSAGSRILTIMALSKETSNIEHWLFYHYQLGFTKVFLVSNDCDDAIFNEFMRSVQQAFVPRGFVQVIKDFRCIHPIVQGLTYIWVNKCIQSSWRDKLPKNTQVRTAFIDTDEYIMVNSDQKLVDIINNDHHFRRNDIFDQNKPQWLFLWRSFGTSGFESSPPNGTFFTNFIMRTPLSCDEHGPIEELLPNKTYDATSQRECNQFYENKTDFSAKPYLEKATCDADWFGQDYSNTPHYCFQSEDNEKMVDKSQFVDIRKIWINHYVTRSKQEWLHKILRGRANVDNLEYVNETSKLVDYFSEVVDLEIIDLVNKLCQRNYASMQDEVLGRKLGECCSHHLLGIKGMSSFYPVETKAALKKYCALDRKVSTPPKHKFACDYLLGNLDVGKFESLKQRCDSLIVDHMRASTTPSPLMKLKVDRVDLNHSTCIGTCGFLHSGAMRINHVKQKLVANEINHVKQKLAVIWKKKRI
jgi:hypothetical protein